MEDSLSNLRILTREVQQEQAAVRAADHAEAMSMSLYQDGATNYLDVVVAQTAALQAQQTALGLQTRTLQATVQLVRVLGGGWAAGDLPSRGMVTAAKASP